MGKYRERGMKNVALIIIEIKSRSSQKDRLYL
ncbi:MAG: hypothetical protein ACJAYJ_004985 [Saprospiraceae bacterium]|jgi:hypothetical protein